MFCEFFSEGRRDSESRQCTLVISDGVSLKSRVRFRTVWTPSVVEGGGVSPELPERSRGKRWAPERLGHKGGVNKG